MVGQDEVIEVFRKAQGQYLSITDAATCLGCTSHDISRALIKLYMKKDLERVPRDRTWVYKITDQGMGIKKMPISEGCKLCMYNINEQCTVAGTPDALDWCGQFVNGKITEILTGKR